MEVIGAFEEGDENEQNNGKMFMFSTSPRSTTTTANTTCYSSRLQSVVGSFSEERLMDYLEKVATNLRL